MVTPSRTARCGGGGGGGGRWRRLCRGAPAMAWGGGEARGQRHGGACAAWWAWRAWFCEQRSVRRLVAHVSGAGGGRAGRVGAGAGAGRTDRWVLCSRQQAGAGRRTSVRDEGAPRGVVVAQDRSGQRSSRVVELDRSPAAAAAAPAAAPRRGRRWRIEPAPRAAASRARLLRCDSRGYSHIYRRSRSRSRSQYTRAPHPTELRLNGTRPAVSRPQL